MKDAHEEDLRRLRTHNQKITAAAMQMALWKVCAQRSYRVAARRQSLSLPNAWPVGRQRAQKAQEDDKRLRHLTGRIR